jgi:ankyrin repeat protein
VSCLFRIHSKEDRIRNTNMSYYIVIFSFVTGQTMAQIHAVIQRLISSPDEKVRATVFKRNLNDISPFEIAAITNNSLVAGYLAEVMYNLIDDTRTALKTLNAKDSQGNTIIHLLARKGDSNAATMQCLLDMRLTDSTRVFAVGMNARRQTPLHIAAQSAQNQPETIRLLHQAMPRAFEIVDADGMTPLHFACQRTSDVAMVATILSYKKDNINQARRDGFTALDLIVQRSSSCQEQQSQQQQLIFPIDSVSRVEIIKLLKNNGGRSGLPEPPPAAIPTTVVVANSGYCGGGGVTNAAAQFQNSGLGSELADLVNSSSSANSCSSSSPNTPHSPQQTASPLGSPYSYNTSPRTISEGSPHPYCSRVSRSFLVICSL